MVENKIAPEVDVLHKVTVRLLADNEVGQFNPSFARPQGTP
jgi:hypothetical protein